MSSKFLIMLGIFLWYCCYTLSFTKSLLASEHIAYKHNIISDQDALLSLKDHITLDPNQILTKNWSTSSSSSICDWIGVSCGLRHYRVTALNISNMGLTGTIAPQLGNLSFLASLDLSGNNFHGELPHELAQLRRLKRLGFSDNELSGGFPSWFGNLNHLEQLHLNKNSFSGSIPNSITNLTNLKALICSQNELSGSIPFEIFNFSSLEILTLDHNRLSGSLPATMCRNLQKLQVIVLSANMLSGPLPLDLSQCLQLEYIEMANNSFNGFIPKEFWNLKMLRKGFFENNNLEGTISKDISNLTSLQALGFANNHLTGTIPREMGNLTNFVWLDLTSNNLAGTMPEETGNLLNLEALGLSFNGLLGSIPVGIFNISALVGLELDGNYFTGSLPYSTGFRLPNLQYFILAKNRLTGVIPPFISNSSELRDLDLSENNFSGTIPHSLGNLRFLKFFNLEWNKLTRDSSSLELTFLTPLANCKYLEHLQFSVNPLNGVLPKSVGNLSNSIVNIFAASCGISGEIPTGIGNLSKLLWLELNGNQLTGSLPTSVASLQNLQILDIGNNRLSGMLSCDTVTGLQQLGELHLHNNTFSGSIPDCIGNITSLRYVNLGANKFSSSIPMNLWNVKNLLELNLSSNFFSSSLPVQVENLKTITLLDLSVNNLSGVIPNTIGSLQNLISLSLAYNLLEGSIPSSIGSIPSLENIDLSKNNLSGSIPIILEKLQYLKTFNVSYNNLDGLIPSGGPFENFTSESFKFNKALCGEKKFNVSPCIPTASTKNIWIKMPKHILILSFGFVAFIVSITLVVVLCLLYRRKNKVQRNVESVLIRQQERISFYELRHATDAFSERNLLGHGSFGSVYKGSLRDGRVVAVKVFNLQAQGALKSFDVECEILRNLRHRNLTQVISSCSNLDFKAIVLEFMPNGSLDNRIHSGNHFLSFIERLNIMIDVASALQYLHFGCPTPVVHADLKPSNVLLDEDMVAHVSDFGIAKMLEGNSTTYTNTLATFGYIAPEYGLEGLVTAKCDVYSFGIMLMEVLTRKRPSDEMFNESLSLHSWVSKSIMEGTVADIIDDGQSNINEKRVTMIMNVALNCTKESPKERSDMGEVIATLNKIKLKF